MQMDNKVSLEADPNQGLAALNICESLLVALTDLKVLSEEEVRELLTDVVATHTEAALASRTPERHHAVIAIIERILAGKNGVPR
jgi:hypothetical protein